MLTRDVSAFFAHARTLDADFGPATARAAFLVAPDGFAQATQSAEDNAYMADASAFDAVRASAEHRELQRAIGAVLPAICFAGDPATPDAVFPNNVFGTAGGRVVIARMRHPVRQREAGRGDIRAFFRDVLGREEIDLSGQPHPCELTGALVIDRARGLGYIGLSERCDEEGARLMHEAFGLRASLLFDLAEGEYHTNVVLSVLAGRAAVVCPKGFADAAIANAIAAHYAPHALICDEAEHAAFVGNCIALSADTVWMSARADAALRAPSRRLFADAGFVPRSVPLAAIEAGGGSLRCCIGEIY
ncbi:amidinotransferase [Lysobacter pythonis]|uniref:Amidinotransferase n=1 Tax=Solilutibacter pythonis TaxID=2483112 RepID=A0A3M2HZS5_9GAMM|nr:arginine deiminase-related protein [Lysobacter pythonis]RMH93403.1 amidinotransferase [Lysobacter pythonis]